jgi:hypothetical protein
MARNPAVPRFACSAILAVKLDADATSRHAWPWHCDGLGSGPCYRGVWAEGSLHRKRRDRIKSSQVEAAARSSGLGEDRNRW